MINVKFIYNSIEIIIQCGPNEPMKKIFNKFYTKANIENRKLIFLLEGKKIEENENINIYVKQSNQLTILVYDLNTIKKKENTLISKDIICPKCKQKAFINLNNFQITIYGCKNGHKNENIPLSEFDKSQEIDLSKNICNNCGKSQENLALNEFYICKKCNKSLCPLCFSCHNSSHKKNVIKYSKMNYTCHAHYKNYNSYCKDCKLNLCIKCEDNHFEHDIVYFNKLIPSNIINLKNNLKNNIDKLNNDITDMIKKLNNVKINLDKYYKIYEQISNSLENQDINYENILSLNKINNNNKINFKKIIELSDFSIEEKFSEIINIYNLMKKKIMKATPKKKIQKSISQKKINNYINNQNNQIANINGINHRRSCDSKKTVGNKNKEKNIKYKNEINLIYNAPYTSYHKIFGKNFVEVNKNNISLVINGKNSKLVEEYRLNKGKNIVSIIIKKDLIDLGSMFDGCTTLKDFEELRYLNTEKVTNFSNIFSGHVNLNNIEPIKNWNVSNGIDFSFMFSSCCCLSDLKPLQNWDVSKGENFESIFFRCGSLENLEPLKNWNFSSALIFFNFFKECDNISDLSPLEFWDVSNVEIFSNMFESCIKINDINPLRYWNVSNSLSFSCMFQGCTSIQDISPLSRWNVSSCENFSYMFNQCYSITKIHPIYNWRIGKGINFEKMLGSCKIEDFYSIESEWIFANKNLSRSNMNQLF